MKQKITKEEARQEVYRMLDKLVLYKVFEKDEFGYEFTSTFTDYIAVVTQMLVDDPKKREIAQSMSEYNFIRAIILPNYLTFVKIANEKRATLPDYQKNVDTIAVDMNEIFQAASKEQSFEDMSDAQWYELSVMSRIVYEHIVALHDKIAKEKNDNTKE